MSEWKVQWIMTMRDWYYFFFTLYEDKAEQNNCIRFAYSWRYTPTVKPIWGMNRKFVSFFFFVFCCFFRWHHSLTSTNNNNRLNQYREEWTSIIYRFEDRLGILLIEVTVKYYGAINRNILWVNTQWWIIYCNSTYTFTIYSHGKIQKYDQIVWSAWKIIFS